MTPNPKKASASPVQVVSELDVESLPKGEISRLLVELVEDGIGQPIRVPVLVVRGQRPGPVFGITAALHGNELNGVPVIHQLFGGLDPRQVRGAIVAVVVANVPGVLLHQRSFIDGTDLNHIMPGKPEGNASQVYAHRLIQRIVRKFDVLVDLHTASFGRINSLYVRADLSHSQTARMAYLQRPQIIVHNPPSDHTLRGAAMEIGIPAITVEIGDPQRFQPSYIRRCRVGLRSLIADAGVLPRRPLQLGEPPVICERSYWTYTDRGGILRVGPDLRDRFVAGEPIAHLYDLFGTLVRTYTAPEDGVVVGRSVNPVGQTGARILHLGVMANVGALAYGERTTTLGPEKA